MTVIVLRCALRCALRWQGGHAADHRERAEQQCVATDRVTKLMAMRHAVDAATAMQRGEGEVQGEDS